MSDQYDYIYFGVITGKPTRLYLTRDGYETPTMIQCADKLEHAQDGFGALIYKRGLMPYSEQRWRDCLQFCERRDQRKRQTENEFKALFEGQGVLL